MSSRNRQPQYERWGGGQTGVSDGKISAAHRKMWTVQISCFVLLAVVLFGTVIAASIHVGGGFPCFFAAVVNYSNANATEIRLGLTTPRLGGVVPVLFFEVWGVAFFFYAAAIVALILACYFISGAVLIERNVSSDSVTSSSTTFLTSLVASSSTLLLGTATLWLLQATLVVMAHKLIVLAACVYLVYFIIFSVFFGYFCGRGVDSLTYSDDVAVAKQIDSSFHRLVGNARAVMVNMVGGIYGLSLLMACLMLGMLLANSFTMKFWQIVAITLITTSVLTLVYLLVLELLVARYVHMLIGPYVGLLVGYGMLGIATNDYTNRFYYAMGGNGSSVRTACQVVLGIFAVLIVIAALVRIIRASIYHKRRFTRAYGTAKKLRTAVKDRASKLMGKRKREDRIPLRDNLSPPTRSESYGENSDEEVIYENVTGSGASDDSEWDD